MKITQCLKKSFCAVLAVLMLPAIVGCTAKGDTFSETEDGNLVSTAGVEYVHLANEGVLYYLGELTFCGSVAGEAKLAQHLGLPYYPGLFTITNANTDNILIRRRPDSEWCSIYRKASLPALDISVDNCCRLELVLGNGDTEKDVIHTTCGEGISGAKDISEFLAAVRAQKDPNEAGLYDLVRKPDGMLENCYIYAVVYGFFEEEPNLAICMHITSYNDLAYSISVGEKEYVLPEEWLQRLQNK